jgi:hypothetical protein
MKYLIFPALLVLAGCSGGSGSPPFYMAGSGDRAPSLQETPLSSQEPASVTGETPAVTGDHAASGQDSQVSCAGTYKCTYPDGDTDVLTLAGSTGGCLVAGEEADAIFRDGFVYVNGKVVGTYNGTTITVPGETTCTRIN